MHIKIPFFSLVFCLLAFSAAKGQTFYDISHLTGTLNINPPNMDVTVTPINSPISTTPYCGASPYFIGVNPGSSGYRFEFSPRPASHFRLQFTDLHAEDTVYLLVNGNPYIIQPGDLSNFVVCPNPNNSNITADGYLTGSSNTNGAVELLVDVAAGVTSIEVHCINNNIGANGVVFSAAFADDICEQKLEITANDDNPCERVELVLEATDFPNTTFTWTGPFGFSETGRVAKRYPISVAHVGEYSVIATRTENGITCDYYDTIYINVRRLPNPPSVQVNNSPQCQGDTVKLLGVTTLTAGGKYHWYGPRVSGPIDDTFYVPHFSPADTGTYYVYATMADGCITDTTETKVTIHPVATAMWEYTLKMGCDADTLLLTNLSTGDYFHEWDFGDGSPVIEEDTGIYIFPNQGVFDVMLTVRNINNACPDSLIREVNADHPLNARFTVDRDTICQGEKVRFINQSDTAFPGTTLHYVWNFGNGEDSVVGYSTEYVYPYTGVWEASLMLQDFLGCRDTFTKSIYVDSTGGIYFAYVSDTTLCVGDMVFFEGDYSKVGNVGLAWDFGDGNRVIDTGKVGYSYDAPGEYTAVFTSINRICPDTSATQKISVFPYPYIDLGDDLEICPNGEPLVLKDHINAADPQATWKWNTPTGDTTSEIIVRHHGVYAATVTRFGCSTTDSVLVAKNCYMDIPNAFNPLAGDHFLPRQLLSKGVNEFYMEIFNRWGQRVFETTEINGRGWDGKLNEEIQPVGVYVYQIRVRFENGTTERYQGNVTLVR